MASPSPSPSPAPSGAPAAPPAPAPLAMTAWILPGRVRPSRDGPAGPFVDLLAMSILTMALTFAAWWRTSLPAEGAGPGVWAGWAEAAATPMPAWLLWWSVQGALCMRRGQRTGPGASHAYAAALACGSLGLPAAAALMALTQDGGAAKAVAAMITGMMAMPMTLGLVFPFLLVAAAPLAPAAAAQSGPGVRNAAWWGSVAVSAALLWPAVGLAGWILVSA